MANEKQGGTVVDVVMRKRSSNKLQKNLVAQHLSNLKVLFHSNGNLLAMTNTRYVPPSNQGPTSTRYSNWTRILLYYSNPTRKFLKNDRVASSMYSSHFRKIAALPPCCSKDKVSLSEHQMPKAEQGMKLSHSNTWFIFFRRKNWQYSAVPDIKLFLSDRNLIRGHRGNLVI